MKKEYFYLFLIIVLALWLRCFGITWGLPGASHANSFHPDESTTISALRRMNPSQLNFNPGYFETPTLQFYLVGGVIKLASVLGLAQVSADKGFYLQNPDALARIYLLGRLLAMLMGVGTIVLVYFLARYFYPGGAALCAALLLAIVPAHVIQSHYMNMDVPLTFWLTLSLFGLVKYLHAGNEDKRWLLWAGFFCGLACSTKYSGLTFIPILPVAIWLKRKKLLTAETWLVFLPVLGGFVLGLPYILTSFGQITHDVMKVLGFIRLLNPTSQAGSPYMGNNWIFPFTHPLAQGIGWPLLAVMLASVCYFLFQRKTTAMKLLLVWVLVYYFILGKVAPEGTRYILPFLPALALLSAVFLWEIADRFKSIKIIIFTAGTLIIVYSFTYSLAYDVMMNAPDTRELAAAWIGQNIKPGSSIGLVDSSSRWNLPVNIHHDLFVKDTGRYTYRDYGLDTGMLVKQPSDYFIMMPSDFKAWLRAPLFNPEQGQFYNDLGKYYTLETTFEKNPQIWGWSFKIDLSPNDLDYLSPMITVWKLKKMNRTGK